MLDFSPACSVREFSQNDHVISFEYDVTEEEEGEEGEGRGRLGGRERRGEGGREGGREEGENYYYRKKKLM